MKKIISMHLSYGFVDLFSFQSQSVIIIIRGLNFIFSIWRLQGCGIAMPDSYIQNVEPVGQVDFFC